MKKTFRSTNPKIKLARFIESVKHDIKKYMKRERGKPLPEGMDFLDFDCKFGPSEAEATTVHPAAILKSIDEAEKLQLDSFYIEILGRPSKRTKKPVDAGESG